MTRTRSLKLVCVCSFAEQCEFSPHGYPVDNSELQIHILSLIILCINILCL